LGAAESSEHRVRRLDLSSIGGGDSRLELAEVRFIQVERFVVARDRTVIGADHRSLSSMIARDHVGTRTRFAPYNHAINSLLVRDQACDHVVNPREINDLLRVLPAVPVSVLTLPYGLRKLVAFKAASAIREPP
jgi:hypothetical protein